jgi:hypothetical protein
VERASARLASVVFPCPGPGGSTGNSIADDLHDAFQTADEFLRFPDGYKAGDRFTPSGDENRRSRRTHFVD